MTLKEEQEFGVRGSFPDKSRVSSEGKRAGRVDL